MAANRWQLILGLVILISMLITAAFAFGVYVGQNGLLGLGLGVTGNNRAATELQNNGDVPGPLAQGGNLPNQPPVWQPIPGLPASPPDVVGRLQRLRISSFMLNTQSGIREIILDDSTKVVDLSGEPLELSSLQQGDVVGIYGESQQGDGGQFVAVYIVRLQVKINDK